jgi:hypothetical protein
MKKNSKQFKAYVVPGHLSKWFGEQLHRMNLERQAKRKAKKSK